MWDPFLDLGIESIDKQHRRIVDFINDLHEAHTSHNRLSVARTLDDLVDYTVTHFAFEEQLMKAAKYPLYDEHIKNHASFTAHIYQYKQRYEAGEDIVLPLISKLKLWLIHHIDVEDRKYIPYVNKNTTQSWIQTALTQFWKLTS
ncbi:hypothetical protein TI05_02195 [Achromatium sp. WMS3]|nr:hypothetical protein TI05_02195 [Achromatium sp. WMS3]